MAKYKNMQTKYYLNITILGLAFLLAYLYIDEFASLITSAIFDKEKDKYLYEALNFFIYDSIKMLNLTYSLSLCNGFN